MHDPEPNITKLNTNQMPRPMTNADFERMIPNHFITGGKAKVHVETLHTDTAGSATGGVVVTVQKTIPDVPMLPPAPTELGRVTETITKSTLTETVMTRVTDNQLVEPLISEVNTKPITSTGSFVEVAKQRVTGF